MNVLTHLLPIGPFDDEFFRNFKTTETGFVYKILEPGEGPTPEKGPAYNEGSQKVYVHYTGYLPDGKKFDSTYDRGQGTFAFRVSPTSMSRWCPPAVGHVSHTGLPPCPSPAWQG